MSIRDDLDREPGTLEWDHVAVRTLAADDLPRLVRIDEKVTGRHRDGYYATKVQAALRDSGIQASLVAEIDGSVVGFLMGQVYYGEFGQADPVAIVETMGVDPDFTRQQVGRALMHQFLENARAFGIERVQTQVDWNQWDLLQFLGREGFAPAPRLCLERRL